MTARAGLLALLAYGTFVVYGSLVPLEPSALAFDEAWRLFAQTPFLSLGAENRADWIANGVLYLPLGLLAARVLQRVFGGAAGAVGAWLGCAIVALLVEFAQLWFPPRTVSQNDLLAEGIGAALGVALAPHAAERWQRLLAAVGRRGADLLPHLLEAYAIALIAFSFFPYDLLLSAQEWADKTQSGQWGWWWAGDRGSLAIGVLKWLTEVVVTMPLGLWWAWRRRPQPLPPAAALVGGLVLGLLIEAGQFAILSGISEGASVVSRGVGVLLGGTLLTRAAAGGVGALRAAVRQAAPWLALPYLALLLVAGGWLRSPLQGLDGAVAVWRELRLLPFYYHYYTTEAAALFSLASVTLMYLPLALVAWSRDWPARRAAVLAALLAGAVEASKLLLAGMRPDPTNVLIAAMACAAAVAALAWSSRQASAAVPHAASAAEVAPSAVVAGGTAMPRWPGIALALAAIAWSVTLPALGWLVALLLAAAAVLVAWRPAFAVTVLLAALPVADFAPWTGRLWIDEWTLLLLVCAGVASARLPAPGADVGPRWSLRSLPLALVGLALAIAAVRAVMPWPGTATGGLADPMSPLAALWLLQGAVAAWIVLRLAQRIDAGQRGTAVAAGFVVALALSVAVVAWERAAFPGLLDFTADYRVTGPFSAMHRGGAYLECFLVVGAAFALAWLLRAQQPRQQVLAALLLAATGYALMVTYSRNGYVALAVVVVLGGWLLQRPARGGSRRETMLRGAAAAVLVAAVALPIAWGGFARERIERSAADLRVRWNHWLDAAALRDDSLGAAMFGMGLVRFPELHHWRSAEAARAATLRWLRDGERSFLRLGPGAPTYVEQWVANPGPGPLTLHAELRSAGAMPALDVALCEKWMLTSAACSGASAKAAGTAGWQPVQLTLPVPPRHALRPLKFSLLAPGAGAAIDVTGVRLLSADGRELLANGSFERGAARWFWTTDVDPPWHIHSLPLALWFDLGWFGVIAFAAASIAAVVAALRRRQQGQWLAPAALVALAGMLTSGLVNTLVDVPRFLFLLLLLIGLCRSDGPRSSGPAAGGARAS